MRQADLARICAGVAADGTDPDLLAAVISWLAQPRRGQSGLRRRCVALGEQDPVLALRTTVGAPARHLVEMATPLFEAWRTSGVQVALVGDPAYPAQLVAGWPHLGAPVFLAWRGQRPGVSPAVAIVGARQATSYGQGVARWLAEALSQAGVNVVSGGARGIDAAAHRAAFERPGGTTVVLGCGHCVAYPRPHAREGGLFAQVIADGGTLVSELLPYEPPRPGAVRERNRIVAALADAVVVVEGGERSGSLLTADAAAQWGRAVFAVPGDIRADGSRAPHRLLAEGAAPCTEPRDLLDVLHVDVAATGQSRESDDPLMGRLDAAWPLPIPLDELVAGDDRAPGAVLAWLTRAEVAGLVTQGEAGVVLARPQR